MPRHNGYKPFRDEIEQFNKEKGEEGETMEKDLFTAPLKEFGNFKPIYAQDFNENKPNQDRGEPVKKVARSPVKSIKTPPKPTPKPKPPKHTGRVFSKAEVAILYEKATETLAFGIELKRHGKTYKQIGLYREGINWEGQRKPSEFYAEYLMDAFKYCDDEGIKIFQNFDSLMRFKNILTKRLKEQGKAVVISFSKNLNQRVINLAQETMNAKQDIIREVKNIE